MKIVTQLALLFLTVSFINSSSATAQMHKEYVCVIPDRGITAQSISLMKTQEDLIAKCKAKLDWYADSCKASMKCEEIETNALSQSIESVEFPVKELEEIAKHLCEIERTSSLLAQSASSISWWLGFAVWMSIMRIICSK